MEIEFDTAKDASNIEKHGISLNDAILLFEGPHIVRIDDRKDYGEPRMRALGEIGGRVHPCIYTMRSGIYRIISLRKANRKETDAYYER